MTRRNLLHAGPAVVPLPTNGTPPDQSKPLHIFWPRLVALQAKYASKVIDALGLADDPVLGLVEIKA